MCVDRLNNEVSSLWNINIFSTCRLFMVNIYDELMWKLWLMNFDDLLIFLHWSKVFAVYILYKQDQTSYLMLYR